jgi:hypothetical protein
MGLAEWLLLRISSPASGPTTVVPALLDIEAWDLVDPNFARAVKVNSG